MLLLLAIDTSVRRDEAETAGPERGIVNPDQGGRWRGISPIYKV
jgi:hypothetical protein